MPTWIVIVLIAAGAVAALLLGMAAVLFDYAIVRKKRYDDEYKKKFKQEYFESLDWYAAQPKERWEIKSADGLALRAAFLPAGAPGQKVAVVVHGHKNEGKNMAYITRLFVNRGFDVLVPDLRAHGASEGRYFGMGYLDRGDLLRWIERVIEHKGPGAKIALHGISMGAATVMMAAGSRELPKNVKCAVEDCGFTSAYEEFRCTIRRTMPFVPGVVLRLSSLICRIFAGYQFKWAAPVEALKRSKLPMLFVHGEQDLYVPFFMLDELFAAHAGPKKRLAVPEAVHAIAYFYDPPAYERALDELLGETMGESSY